MNRYRNLLLAGVAAAAISTSAMAKETGLIFVSSEKDNVVYVLDGSTYKTIKAIPKPVIRGTRTDLRAGWLDSALRMGV